MNPWAFGEEAFAADAETLRAAKYATGVVTGARDSDLIGALERLLAGDSAHPDRLELFAAGCLALGAAGVPLRVSFRRGTA